MGPVFMPYLVLGPRMWNEMELMMFNMFSLFVQELDVVHECLDPDLLIAEYHSDAVVARNGNAYRNRYLGVLEFRDGLVCAVEGVPQPRSHPGARMSIDGSVDGTVDPAFAGVRDAFAANFEAGLELGASLSVSVDGRNVVDLWGGHLDVARTRPWNASRSCASSRARRASSRSRRCGQSRDSSTSTAGVAVLARVRGGGQGRAGGAVVASPTSAGVRRDRSRMPLGSLSDWDAMTALAAQAPWWEPGSAHGYHGVTYGHLVGEVLRRATGRTSAA